MISYNDHYDNYAEGWGVFQSDTTEDYEIQTVSTSTRFKSNEEVVVFVTENAIQNVYGRHARSIRFILTESKERAVIALQEALTVDKLEQLLTKLNIQL